MIREEEWPCLCGHTFLSHGDRAVIPCSGRTDKPKMGMNWLSSVSLSILATCEKGCLGFRLDHDQLSQMIEVDAEPIRG